jgi:putative transposase
LYLGERLSLPRKDTTDKIMPPIRPELLDELLKDYKKPDDLLGQDGLLQQLTKALVERALDGELTHHLGYEKHDSGGR